MNKYLFLDINVLNHQSWYNYRTTHKLNLEFPLSFFDPYCVNRVNKIINNTNAKLVVSSPLKFTKDLHEIFKKVGLPTNFDNTHLKYNNEPRGESIQDYLNNIEDEYNYCILDTNYDEFNKEQLKYLIRITPDHWNSSLIILNDGTGLTETCTNKAIEILNGNENKYF